MAADNTSRYARALAFWVPFSLATPEFVVHHGCCWVSSADITTGDDVLATLIYLSLDILRKNTLLSADTVVFVTLRHLRMYLYACMQVAAHEIKKILFATLREQRTLGWSSSLAQNSKPHLSSCVLLSLFYASWMNASLV